MSENDGKKSVKENTSRMSVNTELNSGSATNNSPKPILGRVYRDWTLEQLISRYEDIETQNEILSQQLADANLRIEERTIVYVWDSRIAWHHDSSIRS